jgi:hypothetical protein
MPPKHPLNTPETPPKHAEAQQHLVDEVAVEQGLILIHFSAQPEQFLYKTHLKHPLIPPTNPMTPPTHPLNNP